MKTTTFSLRRFCRLFRANMGERARTILMVTLLLTLVLLAIKVFCAFFWWNDLEIAFFRMNRLSIWPLFFILPVFNPTNYQLSRKHSARFLTLPVSNMERFTQCLVQPLVCLLLVSIVSFLCAEVLWRIGLSYFFPQVYDAYIQMADLGRILFKFFFLMLFIVTYYPLQFVEVFKYRKSPWNGVIIFIAMLAFFILLIVVLHSIFSGTHRGLIFLLSLGGFILTWLCLLPLAYRGFCRYEFNQNIEYPTNK